MNNNLIIKIYLLMAAMLPAGTWAQTLLSLVAAIHTGKLPNGFTFCKCHNEGLKNRGMMYLVNMASWVLEDEDQRRLGNLMGKQGTFHVTLVDLDPKNSVDVLTFLSKEANCKTVSGKVLTSDQFKDINIFEDPDKIKKASFNGGILTDNKLKTQSSPNSSVLIELMP